MDTHIIHTDAEIRNLLQQKLEGWDIAAEVAEEALVYDDPRGFFADLVQYGCVSSMVWRLIYYTDTHAFFDRHYAEIEDMRDAWEDSVGEPIVIKGDLKNFFAWFVFEETAYQMALELGVE